MTSAELQLTDYSVLLIAMLVYYVPAVVAMSRNHKASLRIFLSCLFLNWTIIGFVVNLIWACGRDVYKQYDLDKLP